MRLSFAGSSLRLAASDGSSSDDDSRVLGLGGSTSRIMRSISSNAAFAELLACVKGGEPASSSYSSTPSA